MSYSMEENVLSGYEIAVIGMDGRFPGASSIHEFWENLKNGKESISFFSDNELSESVGTPGLQESSNFIKAKGILKDVDSFDASFFNYTFREADMMDPQFRILHECTWKALEDAGYDPGNFAGYIGLYAGATTNLFWISRLLNYIKSPADKFGLSALNDNYSLCTQVAYHLNLKGPAVTIQTACSTSLVAIHQACQALLSGECDMALAGGVSIQLPVKSGYFFQEGMVFSSDGHCRAFDANADGTVEGSGVGIVVLKLLENALEEGDHIYAVIKGSAINNDGSRKVGYSAPSINGQAEVIRRAHQAADLEPGSITYIETHGTGTSLGDPVEIQALIQAFETEKRQFCYIGSVKSNIGHLDTAAGAAGFIKTVLALYHKKIPPTLHFETPNPKIDLTHSPFIVNTGLMDWKQDKTPLRAGVSSFGIGGTNAHLVLEAWPERQDLLLPTSQDARSYDKAGISPVSPAQEFHLFPLSARSRAALDRNTLHLADFLKHNPGINPADAAYTLQVGRKPFEHRRTLICRDTAEAARILSDPDSKKIHTHLVKEENPVLVFMFPGLGSQYVNMGVDLYKNEPVFRAEMDRCFEILLTLIDFNLKEFLYPPQHSISTQHPLPHINRVDISQLVVFIIEYALVQLLKQWGITPDAVIGYSFGEYAAACAAGVFSIEDALNLIVKRGELIKQTREGAMLSVPLPREEVTALFSPGAQISLAIDNGASCIVSGAKLAIDDFETQLKQKKLLCMRLDSCYALHSVMMEPILSTFEEKLKEVPLKVPQIPLISNVTGQWFTAADAADPAYWAKHLVSTVRFGEGINELSTEPAAIFLEVGPGRDLSALVQRYLDENHHTIDLIRPQSREIPDTAYLLDRMGRLWTYGKAPDWKQFYNREKRHRVSLPTYSFEVQRFALDDGKNILSGTEDRPSEIYHTYERVQRPENYEAPRDELEMKIVKEFQAIFGLDLIGIEDDFFELGGDSLKVIALVTRLHRELGIEIPMDAVFKNPTVKEIAGYARQIPGKTGDLFILAVEKKEYYPLAPPQRRIFILDQLEEKNKAYNMPSVLWMEGAVDVSLLKTACQRMLERHESLRTGFFLVHGEPVQRVYFPPDIKFSWEYFDLTTGAVGEKAGAMKDIIEEFIRPFVLSHPPLWRVGIVKVEPEKYLLMQNIHHIISDDISIGIMITELAMVLRGDIEILRPLPVQYKDYAVWQWEAAADRIIQEQRTFWFEQFSDTGELPVLELPYDYSRPPVQTFDGAHIELRLDVEFREKLLQLARNYKTTLFVMLFSAYNILLHSFSGQEDIIVGTPITGRTHRDVQQVPGMFVNTLALRTHPHTDHTFTEFLQEVKERTLAAFTHQLYPFEDLVEQLDIPRDISRNPIFDTMFVLHTIDLENIIIPGLKLSPYEFDRRVSKFDITLNAAETISGLYLELEYNTSLFKASTMQHFIDDYVFILDRILKNPKIELSEIKTHTVERKEEEKKQILNEFNRTESDFPADKTVDQLFAEKVNQTPDHVALVGHMTNNGASCGRIFNDFSQVHLSYKELNEISDRLAGCLMKKGTTPDTIVGIQMERSLDMVTAVLAILKARAAYLPIDPDFPEERVNFILKDSKVRFLVKNSKNFSNFEEGKKEKEGFEGGEGIEIVYCNNQCPEYGGQRKQPLDICNLPGKLVYVLYTSGSTGKPKGVMVEHRSVVNILYALFKEYPLVETDAYLFKTSFLFDVSVTELFGWFWQGGRLVVLEKGGEIDPGIILESIRKYRVTHINFVPSLFNVFVDHLTSSDINRLSSLKYIFLAGEALSPQTVEKFRKLAPGIALENIYGPTEATVYASRYSLKDWYDSVGANQTGGMIAAGNLRIPIGKPLPNVKLYILDKYDRLQPLGAAGELCIAGMSLARGYLNKPGLTAERFRLWRPGGALFKKTAPPGPPGKNFLLRTGDMARWLRDGNIEFLGRFDSQVKIRGNRVELGEIETYLLKHDTIKQAVVMVREDDNKETVLWAYIVSQREFEIGELRTFLAGQLPDYMIPTYFMRISRMPYTSGGKIDRKALLRIKTHDSKPSERYVPPGTDLEKVITEIWKEELKLDRVGIDDNFLDLGGTSLKIIRVMSKIKDHLKAEIPIVTLFQHPTIRSLSGYLTRTPVIKSFCRGSRGAVFSKRAPLAAGGSDIAVIGMSCRFPGARNLEKFWNNLKNGTETISFFCLKELEEAGIEPEQLRHPDYVRAMGYLEGIEEFDAEFFEYTPVEAEVMDPQIRLFHETAWEALEDAGYVPGRYDGAIGLYAGASESFYWKILAVSSENIEALGAFELDKLANKDYLCARTAYKLNLKGPVVFVQTACSTSLAAIHMACRGLLDGEADIALAGGVSIMQNKTGYIYREGMIQSPDGHCRAFDNRARGTLAGNGVGIVVLKRLAEARADRDHIYAVIKSTAINNDGMQKIGFTAPSVNQQAEVINSALQAADIEAERIGYIEAHGTGTLLGDPVEIEALKLAFNTKKKAFCALGSVKTNFGHLDSAAGVAGFIKTVLALDYKQIPPGLHFEIPNNKIDFIDSPFYMNTGLREWENRNGLNPRRAGVSSLGLGGTNVHVILEEAPGIDHKSSVSSPVLGSRIDSQLILLSARTMTVLDKMVVNLVNYLKQHPEVSLENVAYTYHVGRKAFKYRRALLCTMAGEVLDLFPPNGAARPDGNIPLKTSDIGFPVETARAWLDGKEIDWGVFYGENIRNLYRISLPAYPFESKPYWLEGNYFNPGEKLSLKKSSVSKKPDLADWFYIPSWKRASNLPSPGLSLTGFSRPENGTSVNNCCMVFTDEMGIGNELARGLEHLEQEVIQVKIGKEFLRVENRVYTINPRISGDYERLFNVLKKSGLIPGRIFHLWSLSRENRGKLNEITGEYINRFQTRGFLSLVFLSRAMSRLETVGETEIAVVTANTRNVTGDDLLNPEAAGVLGAVRVIPQEYPLIRCRSIDVDSDLLNEQRQDLVKLLLAEYFSCTRGLDVAFRGRSRWLQVFEPYPLAPAGKPVPRLRKHGVYLITGGFGNIGFTLAYYLAQTIQARLILVGRSPVPDKQHWQELEKLGGKVLAVRADVSNVLQMEAVVLQAEQHFSAINGVFHAAGDTGDSIAGTLEHLDEQQMQRQFQARIGGIVVLEQIFKNRQPELDFCLAVSSLVSVLGGLGFAAYTAAMSVMDAYVHFHNRHRGVPWISVNTAEWLSGESASPRHPAIAGAETMKLAMTKEEGWETFARILSHCTESQVVISTGDLQARIDKWVKLETLREQERADKSDLTSLRSLHPRPQLSNPYVPPANPVQHTLVDMWQTFFGIVQIGIEDDFFQLGGDSLKAITILSKIHKHLDIKLTIEEFFKCPNIKELSEGVIKNVSRGEDTDMPFMPVQPVEKREYYALSSAQKRLYLIQQMNPGNTSYNIPMVLPIGKDIEKSRLEGIFKQLIGRHESLRTSFFIAGDEPVQRIFDEVDFVMEYVPDIHSFIRPFDLSAAPLMRSGLICHPEGNYTWIVDMHHIVSDGISQLVLTGDFIALYNGEGLETLRLQYRDFSVWQNQLLSGDNIKSQEDYWLSLYKDAGEIPRLDLPIDANRPGIFTFAGDHYGFMLEPEHLTGFKELGSRNGVTLFMSILAVLDVLFYKYTGQEDIIIGSGVAGRHHSDLQGIIGMFVNTLAMRNFPQCEKTFTTFLKEVGRNCVRAFENQDLRLEELVDRLDLERDPSRNPLFDICMVVQNFLEPEKDQTSPFLLDEHFVIRSYKHPSSRFDMTFFIHELPLGIYIDIEYYTGIFKEDTIRRLASHFNRIIKVIVNNPLIKLKDIDIVSRKEKQQLLNEFNDTASGYPRDSGIPELFTGQVERTPDHAAVLYENEIITYSELNRESDRLAAFLYLKGIRPGEAVGVMMERCPEMIISILAILKAGGCYLPVNREYPASRQRLLLADSSAGILLVKGKGQVEEFPGLLTIDVQEPFVLKKEEHLLHRCYSGDLAYIIYTSGSTGNPKGVMVEHGNVVRLVKNTNFIEFEPGERILPTGALEFDASTFEIWGGLLNDIALGLVSNETILAAEQLKQSIRKFAISIMWMTSSLFNRMLQADIEIFTGLKYLLVGGEVLSPYYINKIKKKFPRLQVINGYGPTENTTFSTTFRIENDYTENIPIGKPVANSTAYIINKNGQLQPVGIIGELYVGGAGVARGYLNNPELTAEKFRFTNQTLLQKMAGPGGETTHFLEKSPPGRRRQKLYKTGDLERWLTCGNIEFSGRMDQQVKIRGYRIEPEEIENHLNSHVQVEESVVLVKEENQERYLCAYIVARGNLEISELRDFLSGILPAFMIPAFFMLIDKIPLTPNGKVNRKALPDPVLETGDRYVAPRDNTEEKLVRIWQEVLGSGPGATSENVIRIGINDNFFELGGHSLKAALLVAKIRQEFGVKVPLVEVFTRQTIRGLSEIIRSTSFAGEVLMEIEPVEKRKHYELSFNQQRLWIIQQMNPYDNSYNMTGIIVLKHSVEKVLIRRTVRQIIRKHESLRTGFDMVEGKGVQFVIETEDISRLPVEEVDLSSNDEIQMQTRLKQVASEFNKQSFHLGKPPLFRTLLIKLKEDLYYFAFCMHHIVSDGWSMEILERDFHEIYNTFLKNRNSETFPVNVTNRITYKDYAHWHNKQLEDETVQGASRRFWAGFLKGELPRLRLPVDREQRSDNKTRRGASYRFVITADIKDVLKTICIQNQVTLFTLMYSLYNIWLSVISGQGTVVSSAVNAGRDHPALSEMVGFFVNSVIFRTEINDEEVFIDFARKTRESVFECFRHQHYPLELVLDQAGIAYPEVAASFNMLNIGSRETALLENAASFHNDEIQDVKFDIEPYISEFGNGIEITVNYNKHLFKPETIEFIMEKYRKLVEFFAMHPGKQIKEYKETRKRRSFKKG